MGEIVRISCACGFGCEMLIGLCMETGGFYTLPAVCEECREFIAADYYNPRCPLCGIRPIFYGDTEHKYDGFALYEEKHMRLKGTDHPFSLHIDRALARPNASNRYWCPRCGRKELRFVYTGFRE